MIINKIFWYLAVFFISIPLFSQTNNSIVFIGECTPNVKASVLSDFNSGKYNIFFNRSEENPPSSPCDIYSDMDDTISGCIWSTIPWNFIQSVIFLPNFPDCPIQVTYWVRICPNDPSIRQIKLDTYLYDTSNILCYSLHNYINSGNEYERALKMKDLDKDLYLAIGQYEAEQIGPFLPCDSLNNNMPQQIFYRENSCSSKVFITAEYASVIFFVYADIKCDGAECCKTTIEFCDSLGNIVPHIFNEPMGTPCIDGPIASEFQDLQRYYAKIYEHALMLTFQTLPCINKCE